MTGGLFTALEYVRDPEMLSGLTPSERHVLLAIAVHVGRNGQADPSMQGIADLTGYDRRSVVRIVARLAAKGRIAHRRGGGRGRRSSYIVLGPPWLTVVHNGDSETVIDGPRNAVTVTETVTETVTPRSPEGEGEGVVLTNRDAVPRAAPPWIAEGIPYAQWIRRERQAGRVARSNPPLAR